VVLYFPKYSVKIGFAMSLPSDIRGQSTSAGMAEASVGALMWTGCGVLSHEFGQLGD